MAPAIKCASGEKATETSRPLKSLTLIISAPVAEFQSLSSSAFQAATICPSGEKITGVNRRRADSERGSPREADWRTGIWIELYPSLSLRVGSPVRESTNIKRELK